MPSEPGKVYRITNGKPTSACQGAAHAQLAFVTNILGGKAVEKYQVYVNPYEQCVIDRSTVIKLHRFTISDAELLRFVPSLSPFATKLEAYLRFFGIDYETVFEPNLDDAPRGKVPFISIDGVRISDSDLIVSFLKTALTSRTNGPSDRTAPFNRSSANARNRRAK